MKLHESQYVVSFILGSVILYYLVNKQQIILRLQKRNLPYQNNSKHQHVPHNLLSGHHINEGQTRLRPTYTDKQPSYTYAHLKPILKPLPLYTPTIIELSPEKRIRVTLFDANHCIGAVCFLIEEIGGIGIIAKSLGIDGFSKAVFYTGDVRAEKWWVDALIRNPVLIPYTVPLDESRKEKESDQEGYDGRLQPIKCLSTLYLDTSYASRTSHVAPYLKSNVREAANSFPSFPTKRAGLSELINKVVRYPPTTLFYFRAWTFGYEEVWIALAAALNTRIHVDGYWKSVYDGLRSSRRNSTGNDNVKTHGVMDMGASQLRANSMYYDYCAAALVGFQEGNRFHKGCLTGKNRVDNVNDEDDGDAGTDRVGKPEAWTSLRVHSCQRATPAIGSSAIAVSNTRAATSSKSDYCTKSDICPVAAAVSGAQYRYNSDDFVSTSKSRQKTVSNARVIEIIPVVCRKRNNSNDDGDGEVNLEMYEVGADSDVKENVDFKSDIDDGVEDSKSPPSQITFPYARHSSYPELCYLVSAFRPRSVYPCVVEIDSEKSKNSSPMRYGGKERNRGETSAKTKFKGKKRNVDASEQVLGEANDGIIPKGKIRMRPLFGRYCSSDAKFIDDYRYDDNKDPDKFDYGNLEKEEEEEEEGQEEMTTTTMYSEHEEETQSERENYDSPYVDCNTQLNQPIVGIKSEKVKDNFVSNPKAVETKNDDGDEGMKERPRFIERSCVQRGRIGRFINSETSKAPTASSSSSSSLSQTVQSRVLSSDNHAQAQAVAKKGQKSKLKANRIHKLKASSTQRMSQTRWAAYEAATCTVKDGGKRVDDGECNGWSRFGGLVCAGNNHAEMEIEL